ncbi:MAG: Gfo/Idh/MocA family oxidoreductase [Clostridia bacterium]|nr:Gfo/Idh/MocA family oxidoreductase [Clostridia bacterium]
MKETLRVGVIGCGMISVNHFKAIRRLEGAKLTAVCDIDPAALEKAVSEQGVKGYQDYHDMFADVDVVHICTPHHLHAQMAVDALNACKHVLCEKPMAITAADAQRMIDAAKHSGKQLAICFQNRYNESSRKIRELLDSGKMGKVLGGSAVVTWDRGESYYGKAEWRGKWATEGGAVLINQAIHTFDLLRDYAGEIVDMKCSMSAKRLEDVIEAEDTCDMLLINQDGGRFLFYASNCGVGNTPVQLGLKCEQGEIRLYGNRVTVKMKDGTVTDEDYSSGFTDGKDYWGSGHGFLMEDFYRCLHTGDKFPIDGDEAMKTTILIEKAYTQHCQERRRAE